MTIKEFVVRTRISQSWDEAIKIAREFFQCSDDHEKAVIRLTRMRPSHTEVNDIEGITCMDCHEKKMNLNPQETK